MILWNSVVLEFTFSPCEIVTLLVETDTVQLGMHSVRNLADEITITSLNHTH